MTDTGIVNVALRRIGVSRLTNLRTDQTKEAQVARDLYDEARRDLLGLHPWKFATKRVKLTASATAVPVYGWTFLHDVPDDFIRLISVAATENDESGAPYKLEAQDGGRVIVDNFDPLFLRYVYDLQDANLFSPVFRDLLSFRITPDLAAGLNRAITLEDFNERRFKQKLARAKSIDGMEDFPDQMAIGSWIGEREEDPTMGWG